MTLKREIYKIAFAKVEISFLHLSKVSHFPCGLIRESKWVE